MLKDIQHYVKPISKL